MLCPAASLGVCPRQDGNQFREWEVLVDLEQLCEAPNAMFEEVHAETENKSRECYNFPAADKFSGRMDDPKDDGRPERKKPMISRRSELMYLRDPKKKKKEQALHMKQLGCGPHYESSDGPLRTPACRCCAIDQFLK
ncbi:hypothetical protein Y032_0519g2839 [Ancylostoma ceylanicum]|uniref:Uncharacterized protein n=1 Tax=Ancylostoma ceylanicum TaxID=53326 RepID=A0A016WSZ1_9BILA|nr:hypothetical protein Y032_0519g2839 [Ancylostoma ceylanicum]